MSTKMCPSCKLCVNVKGKKCPNSNCHGRLFKVSDEWLPAAMLALEKGYIFDSGNILFSQNWVDNHSFFTCILTPIGTRDILWGETVDTVRIGEKEKPKSPYYDKVLKELNISCELGFNVVEVRIAKKYIRPFVSRIQIYFESPHDFCNRLVETAAHDPRIKIDFYKGYYDYMHYIRGTVIDICNNLPTIGDDFIYID